MKYVNTDVVFQEIPDEVTLAINISNCPCRCPGCHSKFLWGDNGTELNEAVIDGFIAEYGKDITCLSFMGGDAEPERVSQLARYIHEKYMHHYRTAWYTGRTIISSRMDLDNIDYVKVGPYIEHLGPLSSRKTNQRMYQVRHINGNELIDRTQWFWLKNKELA